MFLVVNVEIDVPRNIRLQLLNVGKVTHKRGVIESPGKLQVVHGVCKYLTFQLHNVAQLVVRCLRVVHPTLRLNWNNEKKRKQCREVLMRQLLKRKAKASPYVVALLVIYQGGLFIEVFSTGPNRL